MPGFCERVHFYADPNKNLDHTDLNVLFYTDIGVRLTELKVAVVLIVFLFVT